MNRAGFCTFNNFIESEEAKFVFGEIVMQVILDGYDSPDGLILFVVADEDFARCRFVERMGIGVEQLTLHDLERKDDGGVVAIDLPPQTVKVSPMFAGCYGNRSHCL